MTVVDGGRRSLPVASGRCWPLRLLHFLLHCSAYVDAYLSNTCQTPSRRSSSDPPNAAYGRTGSVGDANALSGWTSNMMLTTRIHKPSSGRMIDCRFSSLA